MDQDKNSHELSYDTKTIITVIALILVYPVGIIFMWLWMGWKTWVKILVTAVPVVLWFLIILMIGGLAMLSVGPQIQAQKAIQAREAKCVANCSSIQDIQERSSCIQNCTPKVNLNTNQ